MRIGFFMVLNRLLKPLRRGAAIVAVIAAWGASSVADAGDHARPATDSATLESIMSRVLDADDVARYRTIFSLQTRGDWRKADRQIRKLKDRLLMGHVLAQRYLHPTRYRSRYRELAKWLRHYADHPDARRLYRLAIRRNPGKARRPRSPQFGQAPDYAEYPWQREVSYVSSKRRGPRARRAARRIINKARIYSRAGRLTLARNLLKRKHTKRILDRNEIAIARAYIGMGYFYHGLAQQAYAFGAPAARRIGKYMPLANWTAGLSAYRLGKFSEAADHFEAMAELGRGSGWTLGAAAFWAARTNMLAKRPERVSRWLQVAAQHPTTFYGLLASRLLGVRKAFDWSVPGLSPAHIDKIVDHRAGKRGLALLQVGQSERAELEFRSLTANDDRVLGRALLALAEAIRLPSLALKTASMLTEENGAPHYGALYPIPRWHPKEGFVIDRALIFAFMRQESRFNTRAKSSAGARGLMQLMPATAGFMARKRFRGHRRNQLYDPQLNISLGQRYLRYLIGHDLIKGDMLLVTIAYNGGPGNLAKWRRRAKKRQFLDPLLFIESIPSLETRIFVERVLSNFWIYRYRLGQEAPSLDALAAGEPAAYTSLDQKPKSLARNEEDGDVRN